MKKIANWFYCLRVAFTILILQLLIIGPRTFSAPEADSTHFNLQTLSVAGRCCLSSSSLHPSFRIPWLTFLPIDYSSSVNTIILKLSVVGLSQSVCFWIHGFPLHRPQRLRVNDRLSSILVLSIDTPHVVHVVHVVHVQLTSRSPRPVNDYRKRQLQGSLCLLLTIQ